MRFVILLCMAALLLCGPLLAQQGGRPKLVREPIQELEEAETREADASSVEKFDPIKAEKSYQVGRFYFQQDKYAAAESRFREAVACKENYPEAWQWLAKALEKQKKYQEAAAALLEYEQKFPDSKAAAELRKERQRLEKKRP